MTDPGAAPATRAGTTGEGSASDEPERREEQRSDDEGAIEQGSASDEPERREEQRSDDEGAII